MSDAVRQPSISDLLNQFELIGGPEEFGPEGISILLALWRKSGKLGWKQEFQMTNMELTLQTGIKSRDTLNNHRSRLVTAGLIGYSPPPRGSSRGEYSVKFNLVGTPEPVRKSDHFNEVAGQVVRKSDSFSGKYVKVVRESDHFADTVLKDFKDLKDSSSVTSDTDIDAEFKNVIQAYCDIHQKFDVQVKPLDVMLMQELIALGVPSPLIIRVMKRIHQERTARGARITSFAYYKNAILDAFDTEKAITAGVPFPAGLPAPTVALGSPKKSKQQREIEELQRMREEAQHESE